MVQKMVHLGVKMSHDDPHWLAPYRKLCFFFDDQVPLDPWTANRKRYLFGAGKVCFYAPKIVPVDMPLVVLLYFYLLHGAEEAHWAHNPKVQASTPHGANSPRTSWWCGLGSCVKAAVFIGAGLNPVSQFVRWHGCQSSLAQTQILPVNSFRWHGFRYKFTWSFVFY